MSKVTGLSDDATSFSKNLRQFLVGCRALVVLGFCVLGLLGCGGASIPTVKEAPPQTTVEFPQYKIGAGDQLSINVWKNKELTGNALVRPDGMISLPLIGDIRAVELTTDQLANNVRDKLTTFVKTPQVTVIVENPASADYQLRVRITGAVVQPTTVPYRNGMTVMDLVLSAGGLNEFASANKAKLHRQNEEGVVVAYRLKLGDVLAKGDLQTNYALQPSDVITVPERAF